MLLIHLLLALLNTFLICPDYAASAAGLDRKRLGKQRVEAYQALNLVRSLRYLGTHYRAPLPSNPYKWVEWDTLAGFPLEVAPRCAAAI